MLKALLHLTPVEFKAQNLKGTSASFVSCISHAVCGREALSRPFCAPKPFSTTCLQPLFPKSVLISLFNLLHHLASSLYDTLHPYSPPSLIFCLLAFSCLQFPSTASLWVSLAICLFCTCPSFLFAHQPCEILFFINILYPLPPWLQALKLCLPSLSATPSHDSFGRLSLSPSKPSCRF